MISAPAGPCCHHSGPVQSGCTASSFPAPAPSVIPAPGSSLPLPCPHSARSGVFQASFSCPSPGMQPLPPCRLLVDLFAGASAPISTAASARNLDRILPLDLLHGVGFDMACDAQFSDLCQLASSGLVGAMIAAPPCSAFSRARLRPGGPRPVRTPGYPAGLPNLSDRQRAELDSSALLHSRTRTALALVAARGGLILLENPSSSLLWLDPSVQAWLSVHAPFSAHVAACAHGVNLAKAWVFWANKPVVEAFASVCTHSSGFHPSFAGKRLPDGSFASRHTACYPDSLASAIMSACEPFLSAQDRQIHPAQWRDLLPPRLPWPIHLHRVEDGAGTCSSAFWTRPRALDYLKPLRDLWLRRLSQPGLLNRLLSSLNSASRDPPLSDVDVEPFLSDLRQWLGISDTPTWHKLLEVEPDQPFRLNLWHAFALILKDPDADFFPLLHDEVPLGIGSTIPPCKVLLPPDPPDSPTIPLQHCESAWKSALDNPTVVDDLLQAELQAGWIKPVRGGDSELRQRYRVTAVGKLGVVIDPDRPPRLVVDSSISGVTCHTCLPNKSPNPTLADVRQCLPLFPARERLTALVLDVSKAHRRIKIRPQDQGLLCFRHQDVLYQSITLNFGARASGFYWSRLAGHLLRLIHALTYLSHSALMYVDDILALLERSSAPLLTGLIVVLLLALRVPMSWHKASLCPSVVWIGWSFNLDLMTVALDPDKLARLRTLLCLLMDSRTCSVIQLEKLTGKLLWLSSLFRTFRASLAPLYTDQHTPLPSMSAVSPDIWRQVRDSLSADLKIVKPLPLAALPIGCKLLRVGHTQVSTLADVREFPSSRRIWLQVSNPSRTERQLSASSLEVCEMWRSLISSGDSFRSALLSPLFPCLAFADACADASSAGLGGFVRLPDGRQCFFQASLSAQQLHDTFSWFPADASPQLYIATWELLAQLALLFCLQQLLPVGHMPMHVVFRTDNSASESASWKGLSLAKGMCQVLRMFQLLQHRSHISVHLDSVPGFLNDTADQLSRGIAPSSLGFVESETILIPWGSFPTLLGFSHFPVHSPMPRFLPSGG